MVTTWKFEFKIITIFLHAFELLKINAPTSSLPHWAGDSRIFKLSPALIFLPHFSRIFKLSPAFLPHFCFFRNLPNGGGAPSKNAQHLLKNRHPPSDFAISGKSKSSLRGNRGNFFWKIGELFRKNRGKREISPARAFFKFDRVILKFSARSTLTAIGNQVFLPHFGLANLTSMAFYSSSWTNTTDLSSFYSEVS